MKKNKAMKIYMNDIAFRYHFYTQLPYSKLPTHNMFLAIVSRYQAIQGNKSKSKFFSYLVKQSDMAWISDKGLVRL